jgi:hypothetical protein
MNDNMIIIIYYYLIDLIDKIGLFGIYFMIN